MNEIEARRAHWLICSVVGCGRKHYAKTLCHAHYQRAGKGALLTTPIGRQRPICHVDGCGRQHAARGMCMPHYQQWYAGRQRRPVVPVLTPEQRFWSKVRKTDDCWLWTGRDNGSGYGVLTIRKRHIYAHRYSYELAHGSIPFRDIDHLCRVKRCVRPEHLESVTHAENIRRGYQARRAAA